jgi:hypothetical protein
VFASPSTTRQPPSCPGESPVGLYLSGTVNGAFRILRQIQQAERHLASLTVITLKIVIDPAQRAAGCDLADDLRECDGMPIPAKSIQSERLAQNLKRREGRFQATGLANDPPRDAEDAGRKPARRDRMKTNNTTPAVNTNLEADTEALSRWLTTTEVTDKTGLSVVQVRNLEAKGLLPNVKKGGNTYWHVSGLIKLERYMALKAELKAMEAELTGGTEGEAAAE